MTQLKPTLKQSLLAVAAAFAAARGLSESRVSTMAFGDGKVLTRLRNGGDLTTSRFESSMRWFADNWPAQTTWPDNVTRPALDEVAR